MLTATATDLEISAPCAASAAEAIPAGPLRQPIAGLAAARAAGVDHDQLAEIMTQAVRRHYNGSIPAWWALVATQPAEPGRRWPLESILIDDDLQQPLCEIARGMINVVGLEMPWEELSVILSAPTIFTYIGSPKFAEMEVVEAGFNVVINGGTVLANDPSSTFVGARFDPAMSLEQRVAAGLADAAEYADYQGFTFTASQRPGRKSIPRCAWVDICGYREGANLIDIQLHGLPTGRNGTVCDGIVCQAIRTDMYRLMHAYNAPSARFRGLALDFVLQVHI